MDVCKCIVPLPHGGTLNNRQATSPLVWLVEGEERWEALGRGHYLCELAPPSPNFHTTQCFSSSTRRVFSGTRLEHMTRWPRVRDHDQ
ncbi:hypothetical protein TNCV_54071 [Trichonephila clavipes]|nr:hypothetical protein TNCV_54071 [Trichonephila clavipes]